MSLQGSSSWHTQVTTGTGKTHQCAHGLTERPGSQNSCTNGLQRGQRPVRSRRRTLCRPPAPMQRGSWLSGVFLHPSLPPAPRCCGPELPSARDSPRRRAGAADARLVVDHRAALAVGSEVPLARGQERTRGQQHPARPAWRSAALALRFLGSWTLLSKLELLSPGGAVRSGRGPRVAAPGGGAAPTSARRW